MKSKKDESVKYQMTLREGYKLTIPMSKKQIEELFVFPIPVRKVDGRYEIYNGKIWLDFYPDIV